MELTQEEKMRFHKKKCPTIAGSSTSETIHLEPVNNPYFNMILNNKECALLCIEFLELFDSLLNDLCNCDPRVFRGNEIKAFVSLYNIDAGNAHG